MEPCNRGIATSVLAKNVFLGPGVAVGVLDSDVLALFGILFRPEMYALVLLSKNVRYPPISNVHS